MKLHPLSTLSRLELQVGCHAHVQFICLPDAPFAVVLRTLPAEPFPSLLFVCLRGRLVGKLGGRACCVACGGQRAANADSSPFPGN